MADDHPPLSDLTVSDQVRSVVIAGHRGDQATVDAGLASDTAVVRRVALSAALRLGNLDGPLLEPFFVDPDPSVRRRAAELAARMAPTLEIVFALVRCLGDEPTVAEMGAFALGEIERPTPDVVTGLAQMAREHEDSLCREAAVAALGALHTGRETILAALDDKATVRRRAVIALAPFSGPDIDAALERALDDRDWQVRQAAEDLLEP